VQVSAGQNIVVEILPVLGPDRTINIVAALARFLWPLFRTFVTVLLDQDLHQLLDQRARFFFADIGKILELDLARLATVPAVRLLRVGVDSERGDLRPVGKQFDLLLAAVRRGQVDDELRERFERTK
jgi:hypothetical protein